MKRVFLLIPNSKFGDHIERAFQSTGFNVSRTANAEWMMNLVSKENPDAVVVDWDFIGEDLNQVTHAITDNSKKTALVLISNSMDTLARINALEDGADECYNHPDDVLELVAKVKALVRRIDLIDHEPKTLTIKDITIDLDNHEVTKKDQPIDLTYTQFKILYLLASRKEYVFTRDEILSKVWGQKAYVTDRTVDVHVKRLREKLGGDKKSSKYIQTIHGLGYRFA